jgi:AraC-like DNA-binding protein/mannose-6-phosphate isomerase-like protein (cupin superfamily)
MERLSDFDATDEITRLLRTVRVRSTVWCRSTMRAPWGFGVEAHGNPAFHVVTRGRCWLEVDGEQQHTPLDTGDLVVLPAGPRHWVRDQPQTPATELEDILVSAPRDDQRRLHHGGEGPKTGLLCGGFSLHGGARHPLLRALPTALVIRGSGSTQTPWLASTLTMLSAEADSSAPGSEEVVVRLADAMLAHALRLALIDLQAEDQGRVRALKDRQIAEAIAIIHDQPERGWAVGELAVEVALSRSEFASRFRELVGESPQRYLTRTRLAHAAVLLRATDAPLAQIAAQTGYATAFSFSKAFKRAFGLAPGDYRGQTSERPGLELVGSSRL